LVDDKTGRWIDSHVMNQDFVAWVGQGMLADRTQEHLGESDRGVILMRKRMLEEAELVRNGGEPKAVIRDPHINKKVELPIIDRDFFLAGFSLSDVVEKRLGGPRYARNFIFQAGQPEEINQAYRAAMGIDRVEQMELAARLANGASH
jgi:5,5'-dehydrodivanillate O-demethylase oxygenase subunit